jgi:ATP-dependent DNA helicase RecQ
MTRAKETLTLLSNGAPNSLLKCLTDSSSVVVRSAPRPEVIGGNLERRFQRLALADVDLGFAGRFVVDHPVHGAIASLEAGDRINLVVVGDRVELRNPAGRPVGRLAKKYRIMDGYRVVEVRVSAITVRRKDTNSEYADTIKSDRWEVVVPELVYEPA